MSPLAPYQDPALPTNEDVVNFTDAVPEMMSEPPPLPPRQPKGLSFDFDGLIGKLQADGFDSLTPAQQELLWTMKEGVQYSPAEMASFVQNFNTKLAEKSSPKAQAELSKAQLDLASAQAEAKAKANELAQGRTRITSVLDSINKLEPEIDNLVGPLAPAAQMKDKWINPEIYAKRFELANTTKNDVIEAAKYVKPLSNDERKFLEDMFPKIDDPAPVWRNYFERSRRMLSAGLGDAPAAPQPTPQAAPQLPEQRIIGGQVFKLNPQTGKYAPAR